MTRVLSSSCPPSGSGKVRQKIGRKGRKTPSGKALPSLGGTAGKYPGGPYRRGGLYGPGGHARKGGQVPALLPSSSPALALLELLGAWCPEPCPPLTTSAAFFWWKSPESLPPFSALSRTVFPVLARSGQFSHAFRSACFGERFRRGEKLATVSAAPAHAFRVLALLGSGSESVALSSA